MRASLAAVGLVATLTACAASTSASSEAPIPSASGASQAGCEGVSLRAPDGSVILLTGRWIGSPDPNALPAPSVFDLRQSNNCLVWVGQSANPGEPLGESWIETFSGTIHDDFTITGTWYDVRGTGDGTVTVRIEVVETTSGYEVELEQIASTGDIHTHKAWVREDPVQ